MIYLGAIVWGVTGYTLAIYLRQPEQRGTAFNGKLTLVLIASLMVGALLLGAGSNLDGCGTGWGTHGSDADC